MTSWSDIFAKPRRAVVRRGVPPDDVVQEAFARLQAYTREHQVHSPDAFLMRTAINIGRDQPDSLGSSSNPPDLRPSRWRLRNLMRGRRPRSS